MVAEFSQPDFTTQTAADYKASIDASVNVLAELAANFAPHEADTPDLTVIVDAGKLWNGATHTIKSQQTSATFTAPTTDPRIDRIAIDTTTGNLVIINGTEDGSPVAPDYETGQYPICQVNLIVDQATILNSDITDERPLINSILGSDNTFTKTQRLTKGADIASANDMVLLSDGNDNDITGTTDVNGMTDGIANEVRQFHADAIFTLKHNTAASAGFSSLHIVQGEADITTAAGDEWKGRYDGTVWRIFDYNNAQNSPLTPLNNHISGLILSNDADTDHDINITAGYANDSTNIYSMNLSSEMTKQIDASWAAGNDVGGLSSSLTVANNTTYSVFLVEISGSTDILFDTSLTCANGITDHSVTKYRRIGFALTDGSANIYQFTQTGDYFNWNDVNRDFNVAFHTSRVLRTIKVPTGLELIALFSSGAYSNANNRAAWIGSPSVTDFVPTDGYGNTTLNPRNANQGDSNIQLIRTNTNGQIATRCSNLTGNIYGYTVGYYDNRGK